MSESTPTDGELLITTMRNCASEDERIAAFKQIAVEWGMERALLAVQQADQTDKTFGDFMASTYAKIMKAPSLAGSAPVTVAVPEIPTPTPASVAPEAAPAPVAPVATPVAVAAPVQASPMPHPTSFVASPATPPGATGATTTPPSAELLNTAIRQLWGTDWSIIQVHRDVHGVYIAKATIQYGSVIPASGATPGDALVGLHEKLRALGKL